MKLRSLALIVCLALAGFGFLITRPEGLFNRHSDLLVYHLGTQEVLHEAWANGRHLPLWRNDVLSGGPALTNPQSLYTYPPHFLFALFPADRAVGLVIWLDLVIAAVGAFYAASVFGLSRSAALLVGVATLFSFKTILAIYAGWLSVLPGIAVTPLLFGATAQCFQHPGRRSACVLGSVGALALHTGHFQQIYYASFLIGLGLLICLGKRFADGEHTRVFRTALMLGCGGLIAIGVSAYLLIPLAFDAKLVTRSAATYEFFSGSNPLPIRALLTLFNPEFFGTPLDGSFVEAWEYIVYFGAVPTLLAAMAVTRTRSRPLVQLLVAGLAVSIVLSLHSPLMWVVFKFIPGYGLFRLPARMLFVSTFFAFCLAGIGLDQILSLARASRSRAFVAALLIGLTALEGSFWARRYLRTSKPNQPVLTADYVRALENRDHPSRVAPLTRSIPNYGSAALLDLELIAGGEPFNLRHYQTYIDVLNSNEPSNTRPAGWTDVRRINYSSRLDMLSALNVQYLTSPGPLDLPDTEYALVGSFNDQLQFRLYEGVQSGPVFVYRNQRFLDRAFFISAVQAAATEQEAIRQVQAADLRKTAVIVAATSAFDSVASADDRVEIVRSRGGALDLTTRGANARYLVISEVWHPGWHARVDGRDALLYQTDIALQGLWLTPGEHTIELRYWPPGLTVGLWISGVTAAGLIVTFAALAKRRR